MRDVSMRLFTPRGREEVIGQSAKLTSPWFLPWGTPCCLYRV